MIRALVVDDELHARDELVALLSETGAFTVLGSCANAVEALRFLKSETPDVMFLDIRMPGLSAFEMLSMIDEESMPVVVFVTAYEEYAVKAFEEEALDYLLKPVEAGRLLKTAQKLRSAIQDRDRPRYPVPNITRIPCVSSQRIKLVKLTDVDYVKSDITGVYVITAEGEFYTDLTLKVLEARAGLLRCHKQFLVNMDRVDEIRVHENLSAQVFLRSGNTVPVSRRYLKKIKEDLGF